jgi:transmembrane sensor
MKLPEQLNDAIKHYQEGAATAAERQLVEDFYASFGQESTEVDVSVTGSREILEAASLAQVQARIAQQQAVTEAPVVRMSLYKKLAVAAAVIVVASGLYWWFRSTPGQPAQPPIAITDAAPGGNKAVLTLADGSQITLRDAANGMLASQDGVQVIKLDSGRLTYSLPTDREGKGEAVYNTLSTPRGGQYQLSLPDGTKVWLNASSSIRYPVAFTGAERKVEVTGEAYFEVTKNPQQPFVVVADKAAIRVLGTHFNIMAYPEEKAMQTTLLEGSVNVEMVPARVGSSRQSAMLKPGQQGVLVHASGALSVREVDTEEVVAWIHGQLSMKYADVAAFMRQVSRWYDVDVVFEGEVSAMSFSGSINRMVNLSLVLKALNDNGLQVTLVNGKLIVKQ